MINNIPLEKWNQVINRNLDWLLYKGRETRLILQIRKSLSCFRLPAAMISCICQEENGTKLLDRKVDLRPGWEHKIVRASRRWVMVQSRWKQAKICHGKWESAHVWYGGQRRERSQARSRPKTDLPSDGRGRWLSQGVPAWLLCGKREERRAQKPPGSP